MGINRIPIEERVGNNYQEPKNIGDQFKNRDKERRNDVCSQKEERSELSSKR